MAPHGDAIICVGFVLRRRWGRQFINWLWIICPPLFQQIFYLFMEDERKHNDAFRNHDDGFLFYSIKWVFTGNGEQASSWEISFLSDDRYSDILLGYGDQYLLWFNFERSPRKSREAKVKLKSLLYGHRQFFVQVFWQSQLFRVNNWMVWVLPILWNLLIPNIRFMCAEYFGGQWGIQERLE